MSDDLKFLITTSISFATFVFAIYQYKGKKDEEKKVEALKTLLGVVKGWREYVQSVANANTILRNHIRGTTDEGKNVTKFTSLDDVQSAVDTNGAYLNGLHVGVQKELENIDKVLSKI